MTNLKTGSWQGQIMSLVSIPHYKSDEMCKEIVNFVNSLEKEIS